MTMSRRRVLVCGGLAASAAACGVRWRGALAREAEPDKKWLSLRHLASGEELHVDYGRGGAYFPAALAQIDALLRDHLSGEQHPIDPKLLDGLHAVATRLQVAPEFHILSAYRTPTHGAPAGLHAQGRAMDLRLVGVDSVQFAAQAHALALGGVGLYRSANFVHLDSGVNRRWQG
jgi:uncharacterized protein YcbK (DUF882 family)